MYERAFTVWAESDGTYTLIYSGDSEADAHDTLNGFFANHPCSYGGYIEDYVSNTMKHIDYKGAP